MSNDKKEIERIFQGALEVPIADRESFLNLECGHDAELRRRVDTLLRAHDRSKGFLEDSGEDDSFVLASALRRSVSLDQVPGDYIGRYRLIERLGEGGWGVVWMAEQTDSIKRRVALKILKLGMDTREFVARFESERQALALMDHPNIAHVFDGGATDKGRPYFVMELVKGVRITDYCDREQLTTRERLELFIKVCNAIQHAHQKGVIHRDLKPSNILVTLIHGEAVPKVIDFGVAKATDYRLSEKTFFTRFQSFVGTPAYTSPEQVDMSISDVDTRSDIYSLGVLLYEIIVGDPPFDPGQLSERGLENMRRTICETQPQIPSAHFKSISIEARRAIAERRGLDSERLPKVLKGDLDWITMKCLEKSRSRRYDTVNGLAADIIRYLNNQPVLASPPGTIYRCRKFVSRNKVAVAISVALCLSLLIGSVSTIFMTFQSLRAEELARKEAQKSGEISEFIKAMFSYVDSVVELQLKHDANTKVIRETLKETLDRASLKTNDVSPEAQIELFDILGSMYFRIREYGSAETMFRRELLQLQVAVSFDYPKFTRTLNHLAAALGRQGKLEEADQTIQKALGIQKDHLDEEGKEMARILVNLSDIQVKKAKIKDISSDSRKALLLKAQNSINTALEIQRRWLGDEHEEIAASLNELGFILACQGGDALIEAEAVIDQALAMNRKLIGNENPAVASSLNLLTIVQVIQEKYIEAFLNYRTVQSIRKRLEETQFRYLFSSYDVSVWEHQNTGEESLEALHDVVALSLLTYEPESLDVARLVAIQAWTYIEELQFLEAEKTAEKCLQIREKLAPDHWSYFHAKSLLGGALMGQGRLDEAEALLIQGYEGIKTRRAQLESYHQLRLGETFYRLLQYYSLRKNMSEVNLLMVEAKELGIEFPHN